MKFIRRCFFDEGKVFKFTFNLKKNLTLTTIWADSADDKWMTFFLCFQETGFDTFMRIVSIGDNNMECQNGFPGENISKC